MSEKSCAAVILAAGASTRLGQPKQLVALEGEPLLLRTVRMAREAGCAPVIVVTGFEAERMRAALTGESVILVNNADWRSGMGSSVCCGIAAVVSLDPLPSDAMLLVCDQVALSGAVLSRLLDAHARGERPITASRYSGHAGVPAIFSARYFSELQRIGGDRGARPVLERNAEAVTLIDFPDGERDLDTPKQLENLR